MPFHWGHMAAGGRTSQWFIDEPKAELGQSQNGATTDDAKK